MWYLILWNVQRVKQDQTNGIQHPSLKRVLGIFQHNTLHEHECIKIKT